MCDEELNRVRLRHSGSLAQRPVGRKIDALQSTIPPLDVWKLIKSVPLRLVVYNIRYATGTGVAFHLPLPGAGYLRSNRRVLEQITGFIRSEDPDLVGLVEVDTGSVRTGMVNQATHIANSIGHYTAHQCKYG